jgi:hypothetical protein
LGYAQAFYAFFGARVVKANALNKATIAAFAFRCCNDRVERTSFRATASESNDDHGDSFEVKISSSV